MKEETQVSAQNHLAPQVAAYNPTVTRSCSLLERLWNLIYPKLYKETIRLPDKMFINSFNSNNSSKLQFVISSVARTSTRRRSYRSAAIDRYSAAITIASESWNADHIATHLINYEGQYNNSADYCEDRTENDPEGLIPFSFFELISLVDLVSCDQVCSFGREATVSLDLIGVIA